MITDVPLAVSLSESLLAAIFAAQVAQIGFEARLLSRVSTVETKVEERTDPGVELHVDRDMEGRN